MKILPWRPRITEDDHDVLIALDDEYRRWLAGEGRWRDHQIADAVELLQRERQDAESGDGEES